MTGTAPLVDAIAYYSSFAPWPVVGLLAVVLLVGWWIMVRGRR